MMTWRNRWCGGWLLVALGATSALVSGCSSGAEPHSQSDANTGSIGLELRVGSSALDSVTYTITGVGYTKIGLLDVSNSTQISALIGGLPEGSYTIRLDAASVGDPPLTCTGSAPFTIVANQTTYAQVELTCEVGPAKGSVVVTGTVNVCPTIESFLIEPAQAIVGHSVTLRATYSDFDQLPQKAYLDFGASGGTLIRVSDGVATLTCTEPGPITVTIVVGDHDYLCNKKQTQLVGCSTAAGDTGDTPLYQCGDGIVQAGEACDDGNQVAGDGCYQCHLDDLASTPGDDRAGYVTCNRMTCGPGMGCCNDAVGCALSNQECVSPFDFITCDGPEDCPSASAPRCAVSNHSIGCGVGSPSYGIRCHTDADCPPDSYENPCTQGSCRVPLN